MFVIIKTRMHERDNAQQKKDDPKNHEEAFHDANIIIIGPFVTADVFRHTPTPDGRRGSADFYSGAGNGLRTSCGGNSSSSSGSSGFLRGFRGGGSLAAALGLWRRGGGFTDELGHHDAGNE